jgi:hypothetical protein
MAESNREVGASRAEATRKCRTLSMRKGATFLLVGLLFMQEASGVAHAQPIPELEFVTVGAAGNRGTLPSERPFADDRDTPIGAVPYEFRITRTEVLTIQWWEFIEAYRPYQTGPDDSRFTSTWLGRGIGSDRYERPVFAATYPADQSWEYAARFCNWLHNDKRPEQWAFESGVYDTSTFTFNADGTGNHQLARSPGARFWIPSYDELFKAFFYDPDRYGDGQGGYWEYSNGSNTPFISGLPSEGGTTNAGTSRADEAIFRSAQYPDVQSPWGLLDTSGGLSEKTETGLGSNGSRYALGTSTLSNSDFLYLYDSSSWIANLRPVNGGFSGFRVATIPGSSTACSLLLLSGFAYRRRRAQTV